MGKEGEGICYLHQFSRIYIVHPHRSPPIHPTFESFDCNHSHYLPFPYLSPHLKMSTLCPPSFSFLIIFCSRTNFPHDFTRALISYLKMISFIICLPSPFLLPALLISGSFHSCLGEEIWMITTLLQFHNDIEKRHLRSSTLHRKSIEVTSKNVLVILPKGIIIIINSVINQYPISFIH